MKWKCKKFQKNKPSLSKGKFLRFPKYKNQLVFKQKNKISVNKSFKNFDFSWFLAILSGCIMALSQPAALEHFEIARSFLAWFGLIPLFWILRNSQNYFDSFAKCFIAGFSLNLICFRFLLGIHPLDWLGVPNDLSLFASIMGLIIASLQQALYWGVYGILFRIIYKTLGINQWSAINLSLIWIIWQEKIANASFWGGIPWTPLYYSQQNLFLIQIAEWVGGSGISFLIIFANIALTELCINVFDKKQKTNFRKGLSMSLQYFILLAFYLLYGFAVLSSGSAQINSEKSIKALLLQKNISISETRLEEAKEGKQILSFIKLFQKVQGQPVLTIIPEGSVRESQIKDLQKGFFKVNPQGNLIAGSYLKDSTQNKFNIALGFASNQRTPWVYKKQVLVPFGEYTPLESVFYIILKNFHLEYLAESSFKKGNKAGVFKMPFGNIGSFICFEALFPDIVNKQAKAGAESLALIGDSSWFRNYQNLLMPQMMSAIKFRAIESRRDILIDINKGSLGMIDKFGRIQNYSTDSEFLFVNFSPNKKTTFFTRIQW